MELIAEASGSYGFNVVLGNVTAGTEKPSMACRLQWDSVSGDGSDSGTAKAQMSVGSSTAQIDINYSMNEDVELNDTGDAMTVSTGVTAGSNSITLTRSYSLEDVITAAKLVGYQAAAKKVTFNTASLNVPTETSYGSTDTVSFALGTVTDSNKVQAKMSYNGTAITKEIAITASTSASTAGYYTATALAGTTTMDSVNITPSVTQSTSEKSGTYTITAKESNTNVTHTISITPTANTYQYYKQGYNDAIKEAEMGSVTYTTGGTVYKTLYSMNNESADELGPCLVGYGETTVTTCKVLTEKT